MSRHGQNSIRKNSDVPKGTDFNIEEGLECYQNDEESKGVRNVGHLPEELCGIIWNITRHDINQKRLRENHLSLKVISTQKTQS